MTANRRLRLRPYFFELLTIANLLIVLLLFGRERHLAGSILGTAFLFGSNIFVQGLGGVVIRAVVALVRRERAYFRVIRSPGWLLDTLRLSFFGGLAVYVYGFIKLVVPIHHPRLFDQELWNLDQTLFLGLSPNVLFLDLFSHPAALRAVDWSYGAIFLWSMAIAFGYFVSDPSRRVRVAFANSNAALWIAGAWFYMAVPSLGPAYRFPDLWLVHDGLLERTQGLQALLMRNYQNVLRAASGQPHGPINIVFGIGAMPSLHVGFQSLVFFWMRRLWTSGEVLFAIFVFAIVLGSIVTGWHYLVDGIAGFLLALACYKLAARASRLHRWLTMKRTR